MLHNWKNSVTCYILDVTTDVYWLKKMINIQRIICCLKGIRKTVRTKFFNKMLFMSQIN